MTAVEPDLEVQGTEVQGTEEDPATADNDRKPCGHGRMLRKEDPRFIRGQGHYVDDVTLPGMLHMAILRSPVAHARIVGIDTSAALEHPKVKAVITGATWRRRVWRGCRPCRTTCRLCSPPTR